MLPPKAQVRRLQSMRARRDWRHQRTSASTSVVRARSRRVSRSVRAESWPGRRLPRHSPCWTVSARWRPWTRTWRSSERPWRSSAPPLPPRQRPRGCRRRSQRPPTGRIVTSSALPVRARRAKRRCCGPARHPSRQRRHHLPSHRGRPRRPPPRRRPRAVRESLWRRGRRLQRCPMAASGSMPKSRLRNPPAVASGLPRSRRRRPSISRVEVLPSRVCGPASPGAVRQRACRHRLTSRSSAR